MTKNNSNFHFGAELFALGLILLTGCVAHTTDDVKQEQETPTAISSTAINDLQVATANNAQSIEDLKTDVAKLHGDIERLEHLIKQDQATAAAAVTVATAAATAEASAAETTTAKASTPEAPAAAVTEKHEPAKNIDIDEQYKLARKAHEQKNYEEAEKYYTGIIGSQSVWYDERARFFLGKMYADSGQHKKAIIAFQDFADKYPKSKNIANAVYAQAESFLAMGQKKDAEVFFKDVIQRFPKTKEAALAKKRLKTL